MRPPSSNLEASFPVPLMTSLKVFAFSEIRRFVLSLLVINRATYGKVIVDSFSHLCCRVQFIAVVINRILEPIPLS